MKLKIVILFLLFSLKSLGQQQVTFFFDFNKEIPNDKSMLDSHNWVNANKNVEIIKLIGYCDSVDKSDYNKDLAMRRIKSMLNIFKTNAIKISDKVELQALGKDFKGAKNQSKNRKVVIFYKPLIEQKMTAGYEQNKALSKAAEDTDFTTLSTKVAEEKATLATKFAKAKKGELVRISNINFYFNSEKIMEPSMPLLEELLYILEDNPKMRIEIDGHICCNLNTMDTKLSFRRAIVIFKYLIDNGIPVGRLAYKGFGSNVPIYRLPERNEEERAANRRVEILVVEKE
jgi:outer membrane protein OmpA-like peptidoglycan-associated protein